MVLRAASLFDRGNPANFVSHHHQGIDRLSDAYSGWAEGPGGLIEGIRYRDTLKVPFLVGVQWHPERSRSGEVLSDGLGQALAGQAMARLSRPGVTGPKRPGEGRHPLPLWPFQQGERGRPLQMLLLHLP